MTDTVNENDEHELELDVVEEDTVLNGDVSGDVHVVNEPADDPVDEAPAPAAPEKPLTWAEQNVRNTLRLREEKAARLRENCGSRLKR